MKDFNIIPYVVYPFDVVVCFNKNYEQIRTFLTKRLPENVHNEIEKLNEKTYSEGTTPRGRTVMFTSGQTFISFYNLTPGVIAHEVFHAVSFLMATLKMDLSSDNDEAYAYLIGYLTDRIYEIMPKQK